MNLKSIATMLASKAARQTLIARKHSPTALFAVGVVGVVGAAVLASRATLKLDEVLSEANHDLEKVRTAEVEGYSEEDRRQDQVKIYLRTAFKLSKLYAPAIGLGVVSIAALTGSHVVLSRRNIALTAAYAAVDKAFREYRERVVGALGADRDAEFRWGLEDREIVEETEEGPVVKTVKDLARKGSMYARIFDETNPNWNSHQMYNQMFLSSVQQYMNDKLRANGHLLLNEVYDALGMDRSSAGCVVGWVYEGGRGDNYVDFGVFRGDRDSGMRFVRGIENSIWLDFNVDGVIYDKI